MLSKGKVIASVAEFFKKEVSEIKESDELKAYVQDSFLLVELVMTLQEDLGVRLMQEDLKNVKTVGDLIEIFLAKA